MVSRFPILVALATIILWGSDAIAQVDRHLAPLISAQSPNLELRLTTNTGLRHGGFPVAVGVDSIGLAPSPGAPVTIRFALADVMAAEQRRTGTSRGWTAGSTAGAVAGGVLGSLLMLLLSDIDDTGTGGNDDEIARIAGGGLATATVGAVALGGVGAMIGSSTHAWYRLDPRPRIAPPVQRLELAAGIAATDNTADDPHDDLHLRLSAPRRLASWLDGGPEIAWFRLGATSEAQGIRTTTRDTWSAGLIFRAQPSGPGLAPFLTVGLGAYTREDTWLGMSGGLGLRWRSLGGHDLSAEVRSHVRSSGLDAEPTNGMVTVTLGWSVGL